MQAKQMFVRLILLFFKTAVYVKPLTVLASPDNLEINLHKLCLVLMI